MDFINKPPIQNTILSLAALGMAWGLKFHYSIAPADDLKWILAPTAALVETVLNHPLCFESGTGYINEYLQIIIAPACAGVNFLIAAFSMSFFCGIFRISGLRSKSAWLIGCAMGAYTLTICVNAVRIWISIAMITADIHGGWFSPRRVHRITGILIYFFFLNLFYHILKRIILRFQDEDPDQHTWRKQPEKSNKSERLFHTGILPLASYWIIAIGIPWLNNAHDKNPAGFIEHCGMVGIGSISIFLLLYALTPVLKIFSQRFSK